MPPEPGRRVFPIEMMYPATRMFPHLRGLSLNLSVVAVEELRELWLLRRSAGQVAGSPQCSQICTFCLVFMCGQCSGASPGEGSKCICPQIFLLSDFWYPKVISFCLFACSVAARGRSSKLRSQVWALGCTFLCLLDKYTSVLTCLNLLQTRGCHGC